MYLFENIGADGRNRTADLLITNQLLCRLSYVGSTCKGAALIKAHRLPRPACPTAMHKRCGFQTSRARRSQQHMQQGASIATISSAVGLRLQAGCELACL